MATGFELPEVALEFCGEEGLRGNVVGVLGIRCGRYEGVGFGDGAVVLVEQGPAVPEDRRVILADSNIDRSSSPTNGPELPTKTELLL